MDLVVRAHVAKLCSTDDIVLSPCEPKNLIVELPHDRACCRTGETSSFSGVVDARYARIYDARKSTKARVSVAGRNSAATRIPTHAASGSTDGIAAMMRAPSSSRSTVATTNGRRSLNGGTPF